MQTSFILNLEVILSVKFENVYYIEINMTVEHRTTTKEEF